MLSSTAVGQTTAKIDSLTQLYLENKQDSEVLKAIIDYYKTENIDSLNTYVDNILSLQELNNDANIKTQVLLIKVNAYLTFNEIEEAENIFNGIPFNTDLSPELNVKYDIAKGRLLKAKQQYDDALILFYGAVQNIKEFGLAKFLPELYVDIAFVLSKNNDLTNSTKYYRNALTEAKRTENIVLQINIYYALCRIYNGGITVNLDSSVYYGEQGIKVAKEANYEKGYADMLNIVAAPIIRNGEFRKGLEMSREALLYADKYNFSLKSRYYLTLNQGFSFEKLGLYDSALILMKEAAGLRPIGIDHHRLKYLIYKSLGKYDEALESHEVYQFKRDSIIKNRNESKLSSLQARHEANLKEREVSELTQMAELQSLQLAQQRYLLIGLVSLFVFVAGAVVLVYRQKKLKQEQSLTRIELEETQKRLEIEKQYRESELKALRSQMNPHFVFNALNSIQEFIMLNEKKLAGKYLGKFADLMRTYLNHSQAKQVTIQEEVDVLKLYLELEKLRFEESLSYEVIVNDDVETNVLYIPSLLVQHYVENALKNGLLHKKGSRKLSIRFGYDGDQDLIKCDITDNGIGRIASSQINTMRDPNHKSFATTATKNRLELLNYNSNKPIGEEVEDLYDDNGAASGTKVVLKIPVSEFSI